MELIKIIERVKKKTELEDKLSKEIRETRVSRIIKGFESGNKLSFKEGGGWITFTLEFDDYDLESSPAFKELLEIKPEDLKSIIVRLKRIYEGILNKYLNLELSERGAPKCIKLIDTDSRKDGVQVIQAIFEIK